MKKILGALIVVLSIAIVGILILKIFGVEVVSLAFLLKGFVSLILLGVLLIILIITYGFFFRKQDQGYDMNKGNTGQPKL